MTSTISRALARALQDRRLMRAPLWFYRKGLGLLMGSRLVMLEHIGRTSGQPRYVCLEVVERPDDRTVVVASGFGEQAQWYRNLRANPTCWVSLGRTVRRRADARLLDEDDSAAVLDRYRESHPGAWRHLRAAIEEATGHPVDRLPMVRIEMS